MMTMIQKSNESKYLNNLFDFLLKLIKEMFSKYLEKQLESIKKYTCKPPGHYPGPGHPPALYPDGLFQAQVSVGQGLRLAGQSGPGR